MTLIGFSKGVVVLNQILRELSTLSAHNLDLTSMVWLDGGHNGGQDIWPTERRLLQGLVEAGIRVEVRVSPYQVSYHHLTMIYHYSCLDFLYCQEAIILT